MSKSSPVRRAVIYCKGHPNIRASHGKTIEFTEDTTVTSAGTCILGVAAEFDPEAMRQLRGPVLIRMQCGDHHDEVKAETNPVYRLDDPLIIRKRQGAPLRSFAMGADKASSEIDRGLIQALQAEGAELIVEIEEIEANSIGVAGALFVVAAPIGNPEDFTRRALDVLRSVDLILAEDTRSARKQLSALGISTPLKSCHEQNERARTAEALDLLNRGQRIALLSEAGVPTLSDPGYYLVDAAHNAGIIVTPIPGPSAITAALSVSGLGTADVRFVGFLPRKRQARRRRLEGLKAGTSTLVMFEAPHRILESLADIAEVLGERRMTLCRDLTKSRETVWRDAPAALIDRLSEEDPPRGEFTLVIEGGPEAPPLSPAEASIEAFVSALVEADCPTRTIAGALAAATGISRRDAFAEVVRLKEQRAESEA